MFYMAGLKEEKLNFNFLLKCVNNTSHIKSLRKTARNASPSSAPKKWLFFINYKNKNNQTLTLQ